MRRFRSCHKLISLLKKTRVKYRRGYSSNGKDLAGKNQQLKHLAGKKPTGKRYSEEKFYGERLAEKGLPGKIPNAGHMYLLPRI